MPRISFRARFTLLVVALIVLTTGTVASIIFTRSRNLLVENILKELGASVEVNSVRLTSDIEALRNDTIFLSNLPEIQGIRRAIEAGGIDPIDLTTDALWRTQLIGIFSEMLTSKPHYVSLKYIATEESLELVRVDRTEDIVRALSRRELSIGVEDDYFVEAQGLENGDVYLSDLRLQRNQGEITEARTSIMYASTPIYSDDGSVFGVVVIGIDFGATFDELLALKKNTETIYITNQNGDFLLNSDDPSLTYGFETDQQYRIQDSFDTLATLFEPGTELREVPASSDTNSNASALHFRLVSFDPLNPDRYLGVGVSTPYSEIVGEIDSFVNQGILAISVMTVAGIIVAIFVARILIRPLYQIIDATQEISEGRYSVSLPVHSGDEFGQLATSINQMAGRIEQLVGDLQYQLTEAEIARTQAEHSDQVKSAFLASMSHELRTPLNAVINFTKFVAKGDLGPVNDDQRETLNEVVESAKHLLNLINDVLDMSKIESGSLKLFVAENIDLNEIIDKAAKTGKSLLDDRPVQIILDVDPNLPPIRADRQRILQVLLNIISNACKFTDEGSITITAHLDNMDEVVISVTDTGFGIAHEDQQAVFEAFKQTETGLRQGGGTGLGMPIAKNLVEAHGGKLLLESQVDQGTTFTIVLPVTSDQLVPTII